MCLEFLLLGFLVTVQELKKLLGETSEQLKQYGHVNKKALDQHTSFAGTDIRLAYLE